MAATRPHPNLGTGSLVGLARAAGTLGKMPRQGDARQGPKPVTDKRVDGKSPTPYIRYGGKSLTTSPAHIHQVKAPGSEGRTITVYRRAFGH